MCKIVTGFSVESYRVHEVCIKTCLLCSKGVPLLHLFFLKYYINVSIGNYRDVISLFKNVLKWKVEGLGYGGSCSKVWRFLCRHYGEN